MALVTIYPLNHGKHNNLHMNVLVGGSKRKPVFRMKLILFFDTEKAYFSNSNMKKELIDLIDCKKLETLVQEELSKMDFTLVLFDKSDFCTSELSTVKLLEKIKEYESNLKD